MVFGPRLPCEAARLAEAQRRRNKKAPGGGLFVKTGDAYGGLDAARS